MTKWIVLAPIFTGAASLYVEVERVCMLSEEQYFSEEKRYHGSSFIVRLIETRFKKELSLLQMSIVKAISLSVMASSILVGISFLFEHGEDVVLHEYFLRWLSYVALGFFAHFVLNALPIYVPFLRSSKAPIILFFIVAMAALGFSLVKINSITLFNSAVSNKDQGIEERRCLDSEGDVQTCNQSDIVIQDDGVVDVTNNMSMHEASLGPEVFPENTDVLKEVLERSAWLDRDISYVEKLINRGVKVSAETKKWAEKDLKDINEEYYASIKHLLI